MEVAVEDGGAAGESSSESAGEAAQKQVLTCNTKRTEFTSNCKILSGITGKLCMIRCRTDGPTCQIEVLQRSLRSHCGAQFRAESGDAVIRAVDFTFGGSDIVRVCDGGSSVNVLNLLSHTNKKQACKHTDFY